MAGSFRLLEFADHKPVVYLENETSSLFLEEADEIGAYRAVFRNFRGFALDEGRIKGVDR